MAQGVSEKWYTHGARTGPLKGRYASLELKRKVKAMLWTGLKIIVKLVHSNGSRKPLKFS